ncbi:MAG TPA: PspC domain-containing protein [Acidimicrobiia bacterium]|nr:PspC domain-containing protein [Acidimicrobiia bacterium]
MDEAHTHPGPLPAAEPHDRAGTPAGLAALRIRQVRRSAQRRVVAGVAGGLAEQLRVDPTILRLGFVLLGLCGGAGAVIYAVLWATLPAEDPSRPAAPLDAGVQRGLAVALIIGGFVLLLVAGGLWFGPVVTWSVALVSLGVTVVWLRGNDTDRARWSRKARGAPSSALDALAGKPIGRFRLALGAMLVLLGLLVFLTGTHLLQAHGSVVVAVLITAGGAMLIAGPWGWRLVTALGSERRERIRSEERAEMAAHLHDSVLQTLALIQRSDQPREMVALARSQERELRAWLMGREPTVADGSRPAATVAQAVEKVGATVELQFKVPVEVVTVGDAPLDDRLQAIVDATREGLVNAAKHSGADQISLYVEVEPHAVTAFVRDQGCGFDPESAAPDRRGIAQSIRGRMQRAGGTASVVSEPGGGTEVQLVLPRIVARQGGHGPDRSRKEGDDDRR